MSSIGNRISDVRKHFSLSMEKFGEKIGVTKGSVNNMEKGTNNPSEQTIKLICKEFNVNYSWLVDGTGEMFIELSREEEITKYIAELVKDDDNEMKEFQRKLIRILSRLSIDDWKMIEKFVEELAKKD